MKMKRYTVEVVVDLPAKNANITDFIIVKESSLVFQKGFKILNTEEFEDLLPHERARGEKKAIKETIIAQVKKRKLPLLVSASQTWGEDFHIYIHATKAASDQYLERNKHKHRDNYWNKCKYCDKANDHLAFTIDNGAITFRNYASMKINSVVVGQLSDPELTQFMDFIEQRFAWCKK